MLRKNGWTIKELELVVKESKSIRDVGKKIYGNYGSCSLLSKKIQEFGIDTSHFIRNKYNNYVNKKFDYLTVISTKFEQRGKKKIKILECKCDCGSNVSIEITSFDKRVNKSCGCVKMSSKMKGDKHPLWKGSGEISSGVIRRLKDSAKKRSLEFNITVEYIWDLFLKQDRKCALSGVDLYFGGTSDKPKSTASLDRIDNTKGYIEGNVQWVHKTINISRNNMEINDFVVMCYYVYLNNKEISINSMPIVKRSGGRNKKG